MAEQAFRGFLFLRPPMADTFPPPWRQIELGSPDAQMMVTEVPGLLPVTALSSPVTRLRDTVSLPLWRVMAQREEIWREKVTRWYVYDGEGDVGDLLRREGVHDMKSLRSLLVQYSTTICHCDKLLSHSKNCQEACPPCLCSCLPHKMIILIVAQTIRKEIGT